MKKPNPPEAIVFAGILLLLLIAPGYRAMAALGDIDPSFAPGLPGTSIGPVQTIAVQSDGRVLMAGGGIARVNADGSRDTSFVLVQDPDDSIGTMTFNGVFRQSAARLYGDPAPPVSFAAWVATCGLSGNAAAAATDPDHDDEGDVRPAESHHRALK